MNTCALHDTFLCYEEKDDPGADDDDVPPGVDDVPGVDDDGTVPPWDLSIEADPRSIKDVEYKEICGDAASPCFQLKHVPSKRCLTVNSDDEPYPLLRLGSLYEEDTEWSNTCAVFKHDTTTGNMYVVKYDGGEYAFKTKENLPCFGTYNREWRNWIPGTEVKAYLPGKITSTETAPPYRKKNDGDFVCAPFLFTDDSCMKLKGDICYTHETGKDYEYDPYQKGPCWLHHHRRKTDSGTAMVSHPGACEEDLKIEKNILPI
jgi:hypothetical protein